MVKKELAKKTEKKASHKEAAHYVEAVGRRKTAVARVRLTSGKGLATVNEKNIKDYFPAERLSRTAVAPLEELKSADKFNLSVHVHGGGIAAQAEAIRHGVARALSLSDPESKKRLRHAGFLTRDPRMVERKKYGLKKARRAPQWAKR